MARKATMFRTAQATISCAAFKAGDFVKVEWYWQDGAGRDWYMCNGRVCYPEHHLTSFCL